MATERGIVYLLPPYAAGNWQWLLPGNRICTTGELEVLRDALAALVPRPALRLLVPAETVLTTTVAVPSRKPRHIRAAVPNLVEEWLADDLEDLHIAIGERSEVGTVPVAAITRARLDDWLQALASAGLVTESARIDALALPWQSGEIVLMPAGERVLLRWGAYHCGAVDSDQLPRLLDHLFTSWPADDVPSRTLALYRSNDEAHTRATEQEVLMALQRRHHLTVRTQPIAGDLAAWLCRNDEASPLELLQGDFAPRNTEAERWRRWRPAVYTAGLLLALQVVFNLGAGFWLNQRAEHWRAQSTDLYRTLFPGDQRLVNLRLQLQNHLNQADTAAASPFLALFGQLAGAIQATPTESPLQLRSLTFEADAGQLTVELIAPSVAAIDALQKQLQGQGATATILSAANEGERVIGRLRLAGNAS